VSQPRNGSRWSADLQAATVFRPPSIGRPILFLSAGLIRYETVTLPGLRTYTWRRERSEIPVALSQLKELGEQAIVGLSHLFLQTGHSPKRQHCLAVDAGLIEPVSTGQIPVYQGKEPGIL
jgi:hypothetical protein